MFAEEQVVGVRAVDAADLVDIAETLGDEERGAGAFALEQRIDHHGRAVQEELGIAEARAGLFHALRDAVDHSLRRAECLAEQQLPGRGIEICHVGKRAADVGGEATSFNHAESENQVSWRRAPPWMRTASTTSSSNRPWPETPRRP